MVANPIRLLDEVRHRNWPTANAEVDFCRWVEDADNVGGRCGHYVVNFLYDADASGQHYSGHFNYPGSPKMVPYQHGEQFPVRYNPRKPSSYCCGGVDSGYEKIEAILVLVLFGLIAGYFLYAF